MGFLVSRRSVLGLIMGVLVGSLSTYLALVLWVPYSSETIFRVIGILISILIGIGTYLANQRRMAKIDIERGKSARKDVISIFSRAIIQHGLNPSLQEIQRVIDSKSRQYNIPGRSVATSLEVVEDIFTEVLETDYISPNDKKKLLQIINEILITEAHPSRIESDVEYLKKGLKEVRDSLEDLKSRKTEVRESDFADVSSKLTEIYTALEREYLPSLLHELEWREELKWRIERRNSLILAIITAITALILSLVLRWILG